MIEPEDLTAANTYIEAELKKRIRAVEECQNMDVVVCVHPIMPPIDDIIRDQVEDIKEKRENLLVILETDGGSIETT